MLISLLGSPETLKMRDMKMQNWKMRHKPAGVENATLENTTQNCRGGKEKWKKREMKSIERRIAYVK